jgi:large subunit ribosomal protein L29
VPIIRMKDIRSLSTEDRAARIEEMRTELVRLRTMIRAGGTVENPARIKQLRKTIAKILTVEREEKLGTKTNTERKKTK